MIDIASTVEIRVRSEVRFSLPIPQVAYEWVVVEKLWKTRNYTKESSIQRDTKNPMGFRYTMGKKKKQWS